MTLGCLAEFFFLIGILIGFRPSLWSKSLQFFHTLISIYFSTLKIKYLPFFICGLIENNKYQKVMKTKQIQASWPTVNVCVRLALGFRWCTSTCLFLLAMNHCKTQVHNFSIAIDSTVNVFTLFTNNWQTKSMPGSQVQQLHRNNSTRRSWVYLHQLLCRPERTKNSSNKTK